MVVEISDWNDLDNVRNDLTADYVLVNDLDSDTAGYTGIGDDFEPIGFGLPGPNGNFNGTFDGDGFAINDLVVEIDADSVGLFGAVSRDTTQSTIIKNLSVSGSVTNTGTSFRTGGLAGFLDSDGTGTIQNCVSHVDVTALDGGDVGGLVGRNDDTVTDSYATGSVEGDSRVGGLAGRNFDTVTDSYATGSVEGDERVGGLVGQIFDGTVTDSYATGSVEGDERVGGLAGRNNDTIQTSYAVGPVTGNTDVGGLLGLDDGGTVTDSYWDTETTGQSTSDGGTGLTTAEMQGSEAETNMDGFDFANVWSTVEGDAETINGQITLDDVAAETATVILHNFSEPESIVAALEDGYPILLSVDKGEQLDSQNVESEEQGNIARTETDTNGNYSADIPGATGDTIAIAVDFDDGTDRYGRLVTTVLE